MRNKEIFVSRQKFDEGGAMGATKGAFLTASSIQSCLNRIKVRTHLKQSKRARNTLKG